MDEATLARTILQAIFDDVYDRAGFDHWWDRIDDDIQAEIRSDLDAKVQQILRDAQSLGRKED